MIRNVRSVLLFALLVVMPSGVPAEELDYYLPKPTSYRSDIPTPQSHLGFGIGDRHLHHHELVAYLEALGEASDRVTVERYATSYGQRPLIMLTITSSANHARLDQIRQRHRQLADPATSNEVKLEDLPAVMMMGYSVHGNEASAGNAAPLIAYYLAAGQGSKIDALLNNVVVLLDPCLNPDGFERFAQWVNSHKGQKKNPDPAHREHHEAWPGGRTNYYWFDLNRDWLPSQHPESQGRLAIYHQWKPNIVLDFHEMGTSSSYFFQPGVPQRKHPLIPHRNLELTRRLGELHADALDRAGSLYFTEERFDDFYMGKGSTYPDLHGGVGILFEQASSRGHVQESPYGELDFAFAIRNQVLTSLSSLEGAETLRTELLEHKRDFYQDALALARSGGEHGYVFDAPGDPRRAAEFVQLLRRHDIQVHHLAQDFTVSDKTFAKDTAYIIPAGQPEYRFLQVLFERRTEFPEAVFYDTSTWTLPLAFHLRYEELAEPPAEDLLGKVPEPSNAGDSVSFRADDYAYVIDWQGSFAPRTLYRLLDEDIKVQVAQKPFAIEMEGAQQRFSYGTLVVPLGIQKGKQDEIRRLLQTAIQEDGIAVRRSATGLTPQGIDLGSGYFSVLEKPTLLLVVGEGISGFEAGEAWHLLDQRYSIPVTLVEADRLANVEMDDYTTLIMVSGNYGRVSDRGVEKVKDWLEQGGTVISAARWLRDKKLIELQIRPRDGEADDDDSADKNGQATQSTSVQRRPYSEAEDDTARRQIPGTIFETLIDNTHPIGYGYDERPLAVFRDHELFFELSSNPYSSPLVYSSQPLLSGFISPGNLERIKGTDSVVVTQRGQGRVIVMAEDPNFRAFWWGTQRLFLNGVFFGPLISEPD